MVRKSWFTCRVKYQKLDDTGREEKATDSYLVNAYTYTEAEARITYLMSQIIRGNFEVQNITKNNFAEVIENEGCDLWFKAKVSLIAFDDETGKEKQSNQNIMIAADDVRDAYDRTAEYMKGSISSFVIPAINYTKIIEAFPYDEEEIKKMNLMQEGYVPVAPQEPIDNGGESEGYTLEDNYEKEIDSNEEALVENIDEETGEVLD